VQALLEILLKIIYMITLLFALVIGQSFDVAPQEVKMDVQTMEQDILCLKTDVTAEITLSDVRLEPVHDSTKWLSLTSAQVERTACNDSTQDVPYFK
jgi:hypothetical protein